MIRSKSGYNFSNWTSFSNVKDIWKEFLRTILLYTKQETNSRNFTSEKQVVNGVVDKMYFKSDISAWNFLEGVGRLIPYSFGLEKPPGVKLIKILKNRRQNNLVNSKFGETTFYFDNDDESEIDINGEVSTFTLQLIKLHSTNTQLNVYRSKKIKPGKNSNYK